MLLSHDELVELVNNGVIENVALENINSASIDITLGGLILSERCVNGEITLCKREPLEMEEISITEDYGYTLKPGAFILAQTEQVFNLPNNISAEYKLKSSMARVGLNHALAGWCDAGWNGSVLTMELMNVTKHHSIKLYKGDKIGQMIFFKHKEVAADKSYSTRGRYNKDTTVQGVKK